MGRRMHPESTGTRETQIASIPYRRSQVVMFIVLFSRLFCFFGHFGGYEFGVTFSLFAAIGEAGVADRENPKHRGTHHADDGEDTEPGHAIEEGVQAKPTPFLAGEEIHGREE